MQGGPTPTLTSHQPLEHSTMQYSSSASRLVRQPSSQTSRIHPKGASRSSPLNLLHNRTALSQHLQTDLCLSNSAVTIKIRSEGASSPTLPLTQRANAPLKMHILLAHLVYLMHMHHTSGTKRNDIASDTEYPSSHIQFRFLQEEAAGFFSPCAAKQTEPWESVKQIQDLLKETHLVRQPSTYITGSLSPFPTKCEISSGVLCKRKKYDAI